MRASLGMGHTSQNKLAELDPGHQPDAWLYNMRLLGADLKSGKKPKTSPDELFDPSCSGPIQSGLPRAQLLETGQPPNPHPFQDVTIKRLCAYTFGFGFVNSPENNAVIGFPQARARGRKNANTRGQRFLSESREWSSLNRV